MEQVLEQPGRFYPGRGADFVETIALDTSALKWAAVCHDLGKPATMAVRGDGSGRITFYNHDRIGRQIFDGLARRLRWSNDARITVGQLIELHMYPFHLCNSRRSASIGRRACLRIWKRAGRLLPGIFLLAMARR